MTVQEITEKFNTWRVNYSGYLMNVREFRDAMKQINGNALFYSELIRSKIITKIDWHTILVPDTPVHLNRMIEVYENMQNKRKKSSESKLEERTIKILQSLGWELLESNNSKVLIKK